MIYFPPMIARREQFRLLGDNRVFFEPQDTTIGETNRNFSPNHFRGLNDQDRLELITTRRFLLDTLGVQDLSDIPQIFSDPEKKREVNQTLIERYTNMLGIDEPQRLGKVLLGNLFTMPMT